MTGDHSREQLLEGRRHMPVLLIAEDNQDVSTVLERIFTTAGFTVLTAQDGMSALRTVVDERPDVVLTDLDMPRLTGLELCQALRGHHELSDIPVAILSGSLLPGDRRAADAGLCGVLLKPFSNEALIAEVQRLVDTGHHDHRTDPSTCPLGSTDR
jgi:CheY-like chemotaxis protein